jgi:hypothetical protein
MHGTFLNRLLGLVALLSLMSACDFENFPCDKDNLYTIDRRLIVESFEVRDAKGQALWKFSAVRPRKLSTIRYGEVPQGYVQAFPPPGTRPRDFVLKEDLSTLTVTPDRTYMHEGNAMGPKAFCGGYSLTSPRKPPSGGGV